MGININTSYINSFTTKYQMKNYQYSGIMINLKTKVAIPNFIVIIEALLLIKRF